MNGVPCTLIEPGIGEWRRAGIDRDGIPVSLDHLSDPLLNATGALFDARVTRVDAVADLAFLDLGNGRTGVMNQRRARLRKKGRSLSIRDSLTEGERLRVQAVHDAEGLEDKAISVTPRPRLVGRYCTVEQAAGRLNFSKDLGPTVVKRLTAALGPLPEEAALLIRGRADRVDPAIVAAEASHLTRQIIRDVGAPGLVFVEPMSGRSLIDLDDSNHPILVEGGSAYAALMALADSRFPDLAPRLSLWRGEGSMMEDCGVEESIEEALSERIPLPSGGWLSVHPTPALTAIDVNMGSAWKAADAAEAKLTVNLEAALAVAWNIRFQNIGGLIVIDFINMTGKDRLARLVETLKQAVREDPVQPQISGMSAFGLVQINRAKRGPSLRDRMLQERAPLPRPKAAAASLLRRAQRVGLSPDVGNLHLSAPEGVIDWLKQNPHWTEVLSNETGRPVTLSIGTRGPWIERVT